MSDPCNVHDAPDAELKLETLYAILDDLGEADVCPACVAVMRARGCLYPDENGARLKRELGALRMENDYKLTDAERVAVDAERAKCCADVCPWCSDGLPMAVQPLTGGEDPTAHIDADGDRVTCLAMLIRIRGQAEAKAAERA